MASPRSDQAQSDADMPDVELSSSESEAALHEWEWAFAKDPRVDLVYRVPASEEFTLVALQWWKQADKGEPVRLNVSAKYCSSQRYSLASEIKQVGNTIIMMYEHSAKQPTKRYPPVVIRSLGGTIVVTWDWTRSEDGRTVAVQYSYAMSGKPLKVMFYDSQEHVTVTNALRDLKAQSVKENQMSKHQMIKNAYGMHPNCKMQWCGQGAGAD